VIVGCCWKLARTSSWRSVTIPVLPPTCRRSTPLHHLRRLSPPLQRSRRSWAAKLYRTYSRAHEGIGISAPYWTPIVAAGSDVREAQIQVEAVANDTAAHAAALELRRVEAEDQALLGAAILGGGLLVVLLGMLLMAVTRPRWPATR